jgi:hypothetical protein
MTSRCASGPGGARDGLKQARCGLFDAANDLTAGSAPSAARRSRARAAADA